MNRNDLIPYLRGKPIYTKIGSQNLDQLTADDFHSLLTLCFPNFLLTSQYAARQRRRVFTLAVDKQLVCAFDAFADKRAYMILPCSVGQLNDWAMGTLIHEALPELNIEQREFLISGMSLESQQILFAGNYDED